MKATSSIRYIIAVLLLVFFSSCSIKVKGPVLKGDNGKHKGWYKNSNNPHHPNSTNPGHNKGKGKDKGNKGKGHKD